MTAIRKHSSPAFKARVVQDALADERTLVERANRELPLSTQVCLLSVSRSSLYYRPASPSTEEIALKHRIDAIFTEYPFYGSRRITAQLRRERVLINRKAVQRYMREMGLEAIGPVPGSSKRQRGQQVYPVQDYSCPREARAGIGAYLEFYNQRRPHQSLDYRTPAEVHFAGSSW